MAEQVRSPLSIPDNVSPPVYVRAVIYLATQPSVTEDEVYSTLREGLIRTMQQIPLLAGKVYLRPAFSPDWMPGQLELRHDKIWTPPADPRVDPHQLLRKDLSKEVDYTYKELKDLGFPCNLFEDDIIVVAPFVPNVAAGADVFKAQVNFLPGGCLLGIAFYHPVADAFGMALLMHTWAAHCKAISSLDESWEAKEIADRVQMDQWDRDIVNQVFQEHDDGSTLEHLTPAAWTMVGMDSKKQQHVLKRRPFDLFLKRLVFFSMSLLPILFDMFVILGNTEWDALKEKVYNFFAPASSKLDKAYIEDPMSLLSAEEGEGQEDKRTMQMACVFYISTTHLAQLKKDLNGADGRATVSGNGAILALFWRSCMRARVRGRHAVTYPADQVSRLQCPTDARGVYSSSLTTNYTGNWLVLNEASYPLHKLISEETPLQEVAGLIRESSARITRDNIHKALVLARNIKDYTAIDFEFTRVSGSSMEVTSLAAFPAEQFNLGDRVFANGGRAERLRPLMAGFNGAHRTCIILPKLPQGGLEVVVSLFADELDELLKDKEFCQYAKFCCN